ncbi:MAG TPA: B12-binding domain-containing radical SAM protein [Lachnospiraceae bacterium]|nr:B12-binding domain-containing radical SAM protein [Lachnospiraceae bacterium]
MKVLLTAINAKYIHSNLAVYSLKAYARNYAEHIELAEFTINHYADYIIQEIYKRKPDMLALSCYIWNIELVEEVAKELHKLLPKMKIWLGGPEVTYDAKERLDRTDFIDGIMIGEGEETFRELLSYYIDKNVEISQVRGLVYKQDGTIIETGIRPQLDMDTIPFPYENMDDFTNKIIYYESSRGCPYSCSYCLSSIDKSVRFRSTELVKKELAIFLNKKVPQVKFVDRTFNCNRAHTISIWQYIKENDNGVTNFHFEISADILDEEELELLGSMREGLVQLEIGVQSTNHDTIQAINRKMDLDKLRIAVDAVNAKENIHQHLDLIAGLPYENYDSFRRSFNDVYSMKPNQLQLGFLKVLKGSNMYAFSQNGSIVYKEKAPYEVLYTKWLGYDDVLRLKQVEDMVEVYYNSGQFTNSIAFLTHYYDTPFDLYQNLGDYYEAHDLNGLSHSRMNRYEILLDFARADSEITCHLVEILEELLIYDLYLRENLKSQPSFLPSKEIDKDIYHEFFHNEEELKHHLIGYEEYNAKQISRLTYLERFHIDLKEAVLTGQRIEKEQYILFDYRNRNPLDYAANTICFKKDSSNRLVVVDQI